MPVKNILKLVLAVIVFVGLGGIFFFYREIFVATAQNVERITFEVKQGESVSVLAARLKKENIIRSPFMFKLYTRFKNIDTNIQSGVYVVQAPITLTKVAGELLYSGGAQERTITIIPGWDLRDMAEYFEKEGIASSTELYALTGNPGVFGAWASSTFQEFSLLKTKPQNVSLEGYFAPETYRIYKDESLENILKRLIAQREKEFTNEMLAEINRQGKTVHEILTLASIVEKEVKSDADRKKVADLFWRRINLGMGLQADSTVHYLSGREGDVFTKDHEREIDSLYNTYKYRDLPPGPISNPSLSSIMATIYPEKNDAFYFLTTSNGEVKYGRTLDEHNQNVYKFLR